MGGATDNPQQCRKVHSAFRKCPSFPPTRPLSAVQNAFAEEYRVDATETIGNFSLPIASELFRLEFSGAAGTLS
jgi:hypothetical protein